MIASVIAETDEFLVNSIDYSDDTVLRFRKPTTTPAKQSNRLPKMLPITHSQHGWKLADFRQFYHMQKCPFYTFHHPYFGNETHSLFTIPKNVTYFNIKKTYKFKADEEETLEQTKSRPQPKNMFYLGPGGYFFEEPVIPYEVMQKIFGKYSNWDYYRVHKESRNAKKKQN